MVYFLEEQSQCPSFSFNIPAVLKSRYPLGELIPILEKIIVVLRRTSVCHAQATSGVDWRALVKELSPK